MFGTQDLAQKRNVASIIKNIDSLASVTISNEYAIHLSFIAFLPSFLTSHAFLMLFSSLTLLSCLSNPFSSSFPRAAVLVDTQNLRLWSLTVQHLLQALRRANLIQLMICWLTMVCIYFPVSPSSLFSKQNQVSSLKCLI
jgi:hypothetical protein